MAYYSNRLSYQEVENLVERLSGERLLSDQKIWDIVVNKAVEVSSTWQQEIEQINQEITSEIQISPTVDIYDPEAGTNPANSLFISFSPEHPRWDRVGVAPDSDLF